MKITDIKSVSVKMTLETQMRVEALNGNIFL